MSQNNLPDEKHQESAAASYAAGHDETQFVDTKEAGRNRLRDRLWANRARLIWGLCLLLLWTCAVLLFIKMNGHMSAEELLHYQPKNKALAVLAMCALFLLKSVDFLIHSGVLYAIDGILFPLPGAFAMGLLGNVIMSTVPYFIGKSLGSPILERIRSRYPRFREFEPARTLGTGVFAFLLRCLDLPIPVVGLYMGAGGYDFGKYLLGSVLGLIPVMVLYTLLRDGLAGQRLPVLLAALGVKLLLFALAVAVGLRLRKKEAGEHAR